MLISRRYRFAFVHVPKTGGSSIRAALVPFARVRDRLAYEWPTRFVINRLSSLPGVQRSGRELVTRFEKHATMLDAFEVLGTEAMDALWSFAFVRNPWDLQVSNYYYVRRSADHEFHDLATSVPLQEFIEVTLDERPTNQVDFLRDSRGHVAVDFVGRYESLDADFGYVLDRLGLPPTRLPRINVSERRLGGYRKEYDRATQEIVAERFADDIVTLGYEFDP